MERYTWTLYLVNVFTGTNNNLSPCEELSNFSSSSCLRGVKDPNEKLCLDEEEGVTLPETSNQIPLRE